MGYKAQGVFEKEREILGNHIWRILVFSLVNLMLLISMVLISDVLLRLFQNLEQGR